MKNKHNKVLEALNNANIRYIEVWFHGSRAKGTSKSNSDWDYLVVLDDSCEENYLDHVLAITKIKPFPKADIQPELQKNTLRKGSVGWWAKNEGILIS